MNNLDIDRLLNGVPQYRGTFSCDTLPSGVTGLMIANTDPQDKPGEHWIAIYLSPDGKHGEYFDSFGRRPPATFETFLNDNCLVWTFNTRQLQSIVSNMCGYYCIYFCLLRSRGFDMQKIVNTFTTDTGFNDILVHELLCNGR